MMYVKVGRKFISLDRILKEAKKDLLEQGFARLELQEGILELVSVDETGMLAVPVYDRLVHLRLTRYTKDRISKMRFSIPRYLI